MQLLFQECVWCVNLDDQDLLVQLQTVACFFLGCLSFFLNHACADTKAIGSAKATISATVIFRFDVFIVIGI
ncbi:hypothetical protein HYN43_007930 [Mucilaginibacter celer]|uniref:Uncharacterized protein n=1 Tax=Mucilaginibacter celer TaxID=2305508 RepID=A0A494VJJ7_9SPHI|nr:hypothetical protein HYN43_007930 [Mucilaginibacter celer]